MIPVFDSNILIDITRGNAKSIMELERYNIVAISIISWIEVMAGASNAAEEDKLEAFLSTFTIVHIDTELARKATTLRRQLRLKLPDAIILATAQLRNTLLVTRNSKDFPRGDPAIRIPYHI